MQGRHILTSKQFRDRNLLQTIFGTAADFEIKDEIRNLPGTLENKVVATLFFEPSTRTRLSFETAVLKLGGHLISTENGSFTSSAVKGESLEDTIKVVGGFADAIILRHPDMGSSALAASVSKVPIINAGDGSGEHPTQALYDLYTINKEIGTLDNLKVAVIGDLLYGRAVHSLLPLLSLYKTEIYLISPPSLKLPFQVKNELKGNGIKFQEMEKLDVSDLDVLYVTRVQKERFENTDDYLAVKDLLTIGLKDLSKLKEKAVILHPLPRVGEIIPEVDNDSRAAYFRQAKNGLYVRMALLHHLFASEA